MLKKLVLLTALALTLVCTVGATSFPQYPGPPCYPCDGGGN